MLFAFAIMVPPQIIMEILNNFEKYPKKCQKIKRFRQLISIPALGL